MRAPFINADIIQRDELRNPSPAASYEAANIASSRRADFLTQPRDFVTETVFSHPSKLQLIDEARIRGFTVIVMHVGVDTPDLSVARVGTRVEEGGHIFPEDKIRARYARGAPFIRAAVLKADRGMVFDNSSLNQPPSHCLTFANGRLVFAVPYLYGFQAVSTALIARASVGKGRHIDVNLSQSTAALLGHKFAEHVLESGAPRLLNVPAGSYRTADGWIMVTLVREAQYGRLCAVLARDDLATEPRFASFASRVDFANELAAELRRIFATDTTASWLSRLHAADIIADRILSPLEWIANEHIQATNGALLTGTPGVGEVFAARTPGMSGNNESALDPAPGVGQDSAAILSVGWR